MWRSIVVVEMPKVSFFEKAGYTSDGRAIYEAKKDGNKTFSITVPQEKADSFEKLNLTLDEDECLRPLGDEKNMKKGKRLIYALMILGCGLGAYFSRNMEGFMKGAVIFASGITGIGLGSLVFINKNKKLNAEIESLDIKPFEA